MKDFAYVCNILKTKKNGRNQPEIVHILLCIFKLVSFGVICYTAVSLVLGVRVGP